MTDLRFTDRLVRELPGDRSDDSRIRQVFKACYSRVAPTAVPEPELVVLVPEVAELLDLDPTPTPELAEVLGGNRVVPGMAPYAACYGGHQFGTWAGQLGDGRAITLAEVENRAHETWEIQLKGAGPTPYSRRADGRAVLRSSLRELVCSEAMHHLGVPTTRALSLVLTGQPVQRDLLYDGNARLEPGAVVCRVAPTFLRFGNYEIHAARDDHDTLRKLVRFTLERYYPQYLDGERMDIAGFLEEVVRRTAFMISEWMRVGFVHGVMNTDNMSILGLTIDYGPYGWLEPFDLDWTPNITDASGRRYRFGNQPQVGHWNLAQLARALAPLAPDHLDDIRRTLDIYPGELGSLYRHTMLRKIGLCGRGDTLAADDELLSSLGALLVEVETDMTLFFRQLAQVPLRASPDEAFAILREAYYEPDAITAIQRAMLDDWRRAYAARVPVEALDDRERRACMDAINPLYVPRNYLVQEVIEATEQGDRTAVLELLDVLRRPYSEQPGRAKYAAKRPEWARHKPGCSMLSCSS
ncbi:MAG: YdiU family protein [Deltaproteobacteria bacterium]|nr:YdiU family protein [Deltaproteobacteria bacterium]